MAKSIKFNLICKGVPVRTIEGLQDNFSIEDVITYYNDQRLHRWLRDHGYDSELEAVSAITGDEPMDIARELLRIFDVVSGEEADQYLQSYMTATAENIHRIQIGHNGKNLSQESMDLCNYYGADVVDGTKFDILVTSDLSRKSPKMSLAKKRGNPIVLEDQLKKALEDAQAYYKPQSLQVPNDGMEKETSITEGPIYLPEESTRVELKDYAVVEKKKDVKGYIPYEGLYRVSAVNKKEAERAQARATREKNFQPPKIDTHSRDGKSVLSQIVGAYADCITRLSEGFIDIAP